MKVLLLLFLICHTILSAHSLDCDNRGKSENVETKLRQSLFCDYDKSIRPVTDHNSGTTVRLKYIVKSFEYEENTQALTVKSWMSMSWVDEHLQWESSKYANISNIHEVADNIWTPDIFLYNSDISAGMGTCHSSECLIQNSGRVICIVPCSHVGHCESHFKNWPFDTQNCSFMFGSWMKDGSQINYDSEKTKIKSKDALQNNQWKLISATLKKNVGNYSSFPNQTFPSITYNFVIERHNKLQVTGIIIPAVVIIILNLSLFFLDGVSYERFILCGFNLFAHYLFIEQLYWIMPYNGDEAPDIVIFFRDSMLITGFLIIITVIMKQMKTNQERPAQWIEATTDFLVKNRVPDILFVSTSTKGTIDTESLDVVEQHKKISRHNGTWRSFAGILDRILLVAVLVAYILMFVTLLPENYASNNFEEIPVD